MRQPALSWLNLAARLLRFADGAAIAGILDRRRVLRVLVACLVTGELDCLVRSNRSSRDRQCVGLVKVRVTGDIGGKDQGGRTALPGRRIAVEAAVGYFAG